MALTTAQMIKQNEYRFNVARIKPEKMAAARATALRLCKPENKKMFVEESERQRAKGNVIPWFAIAVVKEREAGADPGFTRNIAQGDPWNQKSKNVPRGRGPFKSWFAAADDALELCSPYLAHWKDWSPGGFMTGQIMYNGLGYDKRGLVSPYGYAGTDQYVKGKYVRDGVFDPDFVDPQLGVAAVVKCMMQIDDSVKFAEPGTPYRAGPPPKVVEDEKTKGARNLRKAGAGTAGAGGAGEAANVSQKTGTVQPQKTDATSAPSHLMWGAVVLVGVVVMIVATVQVARQKKQLLEEWF